MVDKIDKKEIKLVNNFKIGNIYALTINPVDKYQSLGRPGRYKTVMKFLRQQINSLKQNVWLKVELSEPLGFKTSGYGGSRIHAHGTLKFNNTEQICRWLSNDYYQILRWASVDIDTISDIDIWKRYCSKQKLFKDDTIKVLN